MKKLILPLMIVLLATAAFAGNFGSKYTNPPVKQMAVTESDSVTFDPPLVSMFVGTAGVVRVILLQDVGVLTCTGGTAAPDHLNVANATLFRGRIHQVCATGTTATGLIGYFYDTNPMTE